MRRNTLVFLLLGAFIFMMAGANVTALRGKQGVAVGDTTVAVNAVADTSLADTAATDSLRLAIMMHNKVIDDSIRLDSINRRKSSGIDAPVIYSAKDSLVYLADTRTAHL